MLASGRSAAETPAWSSACWALSVKEALEGADGAGGLSVLICGPSKIGIEAEEVFADADWASVGAQPRQTRRRRADTPTSSGQMAIPGPRPSTGAVTQL
jgi:hypothetical protein